MKKISLIISAALTSALIFIAPNAKAADEPTGRMLFDKALLGDNNGLVIQCGYEITAPANHWYGIYCQLRLDKDTSLHAPDGKDFLQHWGDVFTPAPPPERSWDLTTTTRWTDSRTNISADQLLALQGLPKQNPFVLWVVCDVWDPETSKWISQGWDLATPVVVTINAGKITNLQPFNTDPADLTQNDSTEKAQAKVCELKTKALRLKDGAGLYRTLGLKNEPYNKLISGEVQTDLDTTSRGQFFQPIDTPQKAAELVKLAFPDAVIIKTQDQYDAIVKSLKKIGDWDPKQFQKEEKPPYVGLEITEVMDLGYRVKMLAIPHNPYESLGLRSITCYEFCITKDGRIGQSSTTCIQAPETPYGAPPMWKPEFGLVKNPLANPPEPGIPTYSPEAAINAYNTAIKSALTPEGSETIEPMFVVTEKTKEVPRPAHGL